MIFYGSFVQQLLCASIDRHTHSVYRNSRKVLWKQFLVAKNYETILCAWQKMLSISFTYYITNYIILPRQNESLDATFFFVVEISVKGMDTQ